MNDHASPEPRAIQTLEDVMAAFPRWHCWEGIIAGLLYGRRPLTSPPAVVRDVTPGGLAQQISKWEREHC